MGMISTGWSAVEEMICQYVRTDKLWAVRVVSIPVAVHAHYEGNDRKREWNGQRLISFL